MDFANSPESSAAFDYGRCSTDNRKTARKPKAKATGSSSSRNRVPEVPRFPTIPPKKNGPPTRRPSASMSKPG